MSATSILQRVLSLVATVAGPARTPAGAGPDTPLRDGGFWLDSVDLVELVIACEAEFNLRLDGRTDLSGTSLATVGTLAEMVAARSLHPSR
jgi:acyl carrier protein